MRVHRKITEPIRECGTWYERWNAEDGGLIACWERGREKRLEAPWLADQATAGQLVSLPWKGGVEKATKNNQKFGTHFYLAMWQGLRGEDLDIDTAEEVVLICATTGVAVVLTCDMALYAEG